MSARVFGQAFSQQGAVSAPARPKVVMLGSALAAPGGISAVLKSYRDEGLLDSERVILLETWRIASKLDRLRCVLVAGLRLLMLLKQHRVSLVHAHAAAFGSFWVKSALLMPAMRWGVPCVLHLHSGRWVEWFKTLRPWQQRVGRYVLRHVDRVVVLSEGWQRQVQQLEPAARVVVVPNPVNVPSMIPQQADDVVSGAALHAGDEQADGARADPEPATAHPRKPRILFLGRLRVDKGIDDLLRAVALVRERSSLHACLLSSMRLTCAGDGDRAVLLERARQLGLVDSIELPGWVEGEAKSQLLAQADVLVLPSHAEGMPVCVLEAMAAGVPVLASAVGAVPEMLSEGGGFCFEPGDVQRLADLMECLLLNPRQARLIGRRGRSVAAQRYARPLVVQGLMKLYEELGVKLGAETKNEVHSRCRVLAVSSGGGHWLQLMRLEPAWARHDVVYASVGERELPLDEQRPRPAAYHSLRDATRWDRWGLVVLTAQLAWLVWRLRPDVVVTTGAAPGLIALFWGRLMGARTAWIDSLANVDQLSGAGRWARHVADAWLTQWPHLEREGGPAHRGSVL